MRSSGECSDTTLTLCVVATRCVSSAMPTFVAVKMRAHMHHHVFRMRSIARLCYRNHLRCVVNAFIRRGDIAMPSRLLAQMIALSTRASGSCETKTGPQCSGHTRPAQRCDIMPRCIAMSAGVRLGTVDGSFSDQDLARASPARRTSILRNSVPVVTRSGKSSRSVFRSACMSMPSGSQPVQIQSALSAPSRRVA